jgi:hypothetical protein
LIHFLVKIDSHTIDIVPLGLLGEQGHESFLLLLDVDGFRALAHATGWIWTEAKEVAKDIGNFLLLLGSPSLEAIAGARLSWRARRLLHARSHTILFLWLVGADG